MLCSVLLAALLGGARGIMTDIRPGEHVCFAEEIPDGGKLAGSYGAAGLHTFPITFTVHAPDKALLTAKDITETAVFSFVVLTPGKHRLCFVAGLVAHEDTPVAVHERSVSLELSAATVPVADDGVGDKQVLADRILEAAREVRRDIKFMEAREGRLRAIMGSIGLGIVVTAVLSVGAMWITMISTTNWTATIVRKRM